MAENAETICWRNQPWLLAYPLNSLTVLDYFACSPFYDSSCNNTELQLRGLGREHLKCAPLLPSAPGAPSAQEPR